MPIGLLLVLVVGGIAGIAAMLHIMGYSRKFRIEDAQHASAIWADAYPRQDVREVVVAEDHHAACLRTNLGPGVIWAFGADPATRGLTHDRFSHRADARGITISTDDITAPKIVIHLTEAERPAWYAILGNPWP